MAAIGELIGYIAHEINNPIGIITLKLTSSPPPACRAAPL